MLVHCTSIEFQKGVMELGSQAVFPDFLKRVLAYGAEFLG